MAMKVSGGDAAILLSVRLGSGMLFECPDHGAHHGAAKTALNVDMTKTRAVHWSTKRARSHPWR